MASQHRHQHRLAGFQRASNLLSFFISGASSSTRRRSTSALLGRHDGLDHGDRALALAQGHRAQHHPRRQLHRVRLCSTCCRHEDASDSQRAPVVPASPRGRPLTKDCPAAGWQQGERPMIVLCLLCALRLPACVCCCLPFITLCMLLLHLCRISNNKSYTRVQ